MSEKKRNKQDSHEAIWQRLKRGDMLALEELYTQYFTLLYNYGRHLVRDESLVEDCFQDLFITLWQRRASLGDVTFTRQYLLSSFRRKLFEELKKRKHFQSIEHIRSDFELLPSQESELVAQQSDTEQKERLFQALNELSIQQKEALFLKFYNDLSYQEVAHIMSLKADTTYKIISRAIKALRKKMNKLHAWLNF